MSYSLIVGGAALITLTLLDVVSTTIRVSNRGGPISLRLTTQLWKLVIAHRRSLPVAGIAITLGVVMLWVGGMWAGWFLIFSGASDAVVQSSTGVPASAWERVYFVGFTIFTLGNGDFRPATDVWRIATTLASATGLTIITLAITYLVQVMTAGVDKRQLAKHVTFLGGSPQSLAAKALGEPVQWFEQTLTSLIPNLILLGQRHLAYPVLHYFQDVDSSTSEAVAIARLDEALTILKFGVTDLPVSSTMVDTARAAIDDLLKGMDPWVVVDPRDPPPPPDLAPLSARGASTADPEAFATAIETLSGRRRALLALVLNSGHDWDSVAART